MWDLIVSVPDHCLSSFSQTVMLVKKEYISLDAMLKQDVYLACMKYKERYFFIIPKQV